MPAWITHSNSGLHNEPYVRETLGFSGATADFVQGKS